MIAGIEATSVFPDLCLGAVTADSGVCPSIRGLTIGVMMPAQKDVASDCPDRCAKRDIFNRCDPVQTRTGVENSVVTEELRLQKRTFDERIGMRMSLIELPEVQ